MGGYNRATELLQQNRNILENLAQALLERETLNALEVKNIIEGKNEIDPDPSGGEPEAIKPEASAEKLKTKKDPEEGLLGGGGMPDPTPA
jgi:cell division protease FtsH